MQKSFLPTTDRTAAKHRLLEAGKSTQKSLFRLYRTSENGLKSKQVDAMRLTYGNNTIRYRKKEPLFIRLFKAFINPFTSVLLCLAIISSITDIFMAQAGHRDYSAVSIIMIMVIVSGCLSFFQEEKSSKAAEKLRNMIKTDTTVLRDGKQIDVPISELVVGDVVVLSAGDMLPADCRILKAKDLFISQSSLTGESEPVEKTDFSIKEHARNPLELNNLAFMGSNVVSGSATALVIAVGGETEFGSIARQLSAKHVPNNFEKGVNSISWVFIRFILIITPVVLFINGFTKGDWMEALLFALSVAVGLTPEMLPTIISANLAKGAVIMSRKKVIVKNLNSIQNFGAMDVLCTDKTGTITQDKIILEYHLNIDDEEDEYVLKSAFLNSYFQTGLKNLMDISIIEHAKEQDLSDLKTEYRKVDEIPFDFNRRRMSVVIEDKQKRTRLITKGAIEEMLSVCKYAKDGKRVKLISPTLREKILATCRKYNESGMRILAVAQKKEHIRAGAFSVHDEKDMVLIGYLAFLDPPKSDAAEAIKKLAEYGVTVKVLTGDNAAVTKSVCGQVGIPNETVVLGSDIEHMDDSTLRKLVEENNIFAKLSPGQKARIVSALRSNGHVVGFMGDGINDAVAMKAADVSISVDTAVDIAKESANIILLEKSLMVLEEGVIEGRKVYANTIKYIKMTASSNLGNILPILLASSFLPFLPMLPIQILMLNLIYDLSCTTIPWDNVDKDYLRIPRRWNASSVSRFMLWIGPTSSVFDLATYAFLFFFLCPALMGDTFFNLSAEGQLGFAAIFHTGWFLESIWTQTLIIHLLRTEKIPFIQSRASIHVFILTTLGVFIGSVLPYTALGKTLGLVPIPFIFYPFLLAVIFGYMILVTVVKKLFIRRYGELL